MDGEPETPDEVVTVRKRCSALRQFEHPEGAAAAGRILNLGNERWPSGCVRAAVADGKRDVLFSVHREADGRGARNIVQAGPPEFRARAVVTGTEPAVNRSAKYQPARRRENA